jgi:hypothetical protein
MFLRSYLKLCCCLLECTIPFSGAAARLNVTVLDRRQFADK